MGTMVTNGVSFSLVAGAVCVVHFSSGPKSANSSVVTLNINSTGAKNVKMHWSYINTSYGTCTLSSYSMLIDAFPPTKSLYIYDGSEYNVTLGGRPYSDYSD